MHRLRPGEDGQPLDHGAGQEMRFFRLQDDVTASGHALALSTGTLERPDGVPTLERGNDLKTYGYIELSIVRTTTRRECQKQYVFTGFIGVIDDSEITDTISPHTTLLTRKRFNSISIWCYWVCCYFSDSF